MRRLPKKSLIAMIAVKALPSAPLYKGKDSEIIKSALSDLEQYKKVGVDSIFLENDHDLPYTKEPLPPKAIQVLTKVTKEVRKRFKGPIGIQVLEANNEQALNVAVKADLDYLRVEGYVFGHLGGAGLIEGCAGKLQRQRKKLGAEHIKLYADVKKKHCSHAITDDFDITGEIKQAEFFLVDGVIVTSQFTGKNPKKGDLVKAKKATKLPILIGSGMTSENIKNYMPLADHFIVGTTFRKDRKFLEEIDPERLEKFVSKFKKIRTKYI